MLPVGGGIVQPAQVIGKLGLQVLSQAGLIAAVCAGVFVGIEGHPQGRMHGVGDKEQPFQPVAPPRIVRRRAQPAVGVRQPQQDRACLEQHAVRGFQRRDQPVGVQCTVSGCFLCTGGTVHQTRLVGQPGMVQRQPNDQRGIVRGKVQHICHLRRHSARQTVDALHLRPISSES